MLKAVIAKYLCLHKWQEIIKRDVYYSQFSKEVHILVCEKCGKIHKIEILRKLFNKLFINYRAN